MRHVLGAAVVSRVAGGAVTGLLGPLVHTAPSVLTHPLLARRVARAAWPGAQRRGVGGGGGGGRGIGGVGGGGRGIGGVGGGGRDAVEVRHQVDRTAIDEQVLKRSNEEKNCVNQPSSIKSSRL